MVHAGVLPPSRRASPRSGQRRIHLRAGAGHRGSRAGGRRRAQRPRPLCHGAAHHRTHRGRAMPARRERTSDGRGGGAVMPAGVLFDIDGVLVLSWRAIPGAAKTVRYLVDRRVPCSYLTNTTTRTRQQIAAALADAGITVAADDVITAAVLTAEYLRTAHPAARCFLVNSGDI